MDDNFSNLQNLSQDLSELITKREEDCDCHLANKLKDPNHTQKLSAKSSKSFKMEKIPLTTAIIVNDIFFQIRKEKLMILINYLLLKVHALIMA